MYSTNKTFILDSNGELKKNLEDATISDLIIHYCSKTNEFRVVKPPKGTTFLQKDAALSVMLILRKKIWPNCDDPICVSSKKICYFAIVDSTRLVIKIPDKNVSRYALKTIYCMFSDYISDDFKHEPCIIKIDSEGKKEIPSGADGWERWKKLKIIG